MLYAGIVDQDIEASETGYGFFHRRATLLGIRQVGLEEGSPGLVGDLCPLITEIDRQHLMPGIAHRLHDGGADTA